MVRTVPFIAFSCRSVQGERTVVTAGVINTEWDGCDQWLAQGLCHPMFQYVKHNLKTSEGKKTSLGFQCWVSCVCLLQWFQL